MEILNLLMQLHHPPKKTDTMAVIMYCFAVYIPCMRCFASKITHKYIFFIGKKIGELTHEKIKQSIDNKNWIHDIAVREGKMVLACRAEGVMLFNIS